jgi:hypothetical protein
MLAAAVVEGADTRPLLIALTVAVGLAVGRLAIRLVAVPAVVAAFGLAGFAAELHLGLRAIGRILLLVAALTATAVLAAPIVPLAIELPSVLLATLVLAPILLTAAVLLASVLLAVIVAARLLALTLTLDLLVGREAVQLAVAFLAVLAAEILAVIAFRAETPVGIVRLLLGLLFLSSRDDAVVVLGVLQVILSHDPIARGRRVPRELEVFLVNLESAAADTNVGAV